MPRVPRAELKQNYEMDNARKGEGRPGGVPVVNQEVYRSESGVHLCAGGRSDEPGRCPGATPFDVEGCELGHHGEDVSFNSILKKHNLTDPALGLLGEVVRAADSHPSSPHPAGEGLRWVAFGFSALGLSDLQILEREFIVYDALYAECKRRTDGSSKREVKG
jgi:hypothetical protein